MDYRRRRCENRAAVRHWFDGNVERADILRSGDRLKFVHAAERTHDHIRHGPVDHGHIHDRLTGDLPDRLAKAVSLRFS